MSEYLYKRVLLKLSGEALMGEGRYGIDPEVTEFCSEFDYTFGYLAYRTGHHILMPHKPTSENRNKRNYQYCRGNGKISYEGFSRLQQRKRISRRGQNQRSRKSYEETYL